MASPFLLFSPDRIRRKETTLSPALLASMREAAYPDSAQYDVAHAEAETLRLPIRAVLGTRVSITLKHFVIMRLGDIPAVLKPSGGIVQDAL